jgi:hypothetical protein
MAFGKKTAKKLTLFLYICKKKLGLALFRTLFRRMPIALTTSTLGM